MATRVITACGQGDTMESYLSAVSAHNILSATHTDTLASTVSRGSVIVGNATPVYAEVTIGAANTYFSSDGTDATWGKIVAGGITLAEGNLLVGNNAGVGVALDIGNTDKGLAIGNGTTAAIYAVSGDISLSNAGVAAIETGVIVNADVNGSAAIAYSKLNLTGAVLNADINATAGITVGKIALTTGSIMLGTASVGAALDVSTDTAIMIGNGSTAAMQTIGGDITLANDGTVAIAGTVIVDADVNAAAAIQESKLLSVGLLC